MTKIEMLFIRACKSLNPYKRIDSVYRRFYGKYEDNTWYKVGILIVIIEKYFPIHLLSVVSALNPSMCLFKGLPNSYEKNVLYMLYSHIRFVNDNKLPEDFIKPVRFRRK